MLQLRADLRAEESVSKHGDVGTCGSDSDPYAIRTLNAIDVSFAGFCLAFCFETEIVGINAFE